jgi:hypothetical protein
MGGPLKRWFTLSAWLIGGRPLGPITYNICTDDDKVDDLDWVDVSDDWPAWAFKYCTMFGMCQPSNV